MSLLDDEEDTSEGCGLKKTGWGLVTLDMLDGGGVMLPLSNMWSIPS